MVLVGILKGFAAAAASLDAVALDSVGGLNIVALAGEAVDVVVVVPAVTLDAADAVLKLKFAEVPNGTDAVVDNAVNPVDVVDEPNIAEENTPPAVEDETAEPPDEAAVAFDVAPNPPNIGGVAAGTVPVDAADVGRLADMPPKLKVLGICSGFTVVFAEDSATFDDLLAAKGVKP